MADAHPWSMPTVVAMSHRGSMAEPKTTRNDAEVADFLAAVPDPPRITDAEAVCALMTGVTGAPPRMWGHRTRSIGRGGQKVRTACSS
jgi:hypothetical protein